MKVILNEAGEEIVCGDLPLPVVKDVEPKEDYKLLVTFKTGEKRVHDAKPLLEYKMCEPLKNPGFFRQAKALHGTVVWTDDIDIDPVHLYESSTPIKGENA